MWGETAAPGPFSVHAPRGSHHAHANRPQSSLTALGRAAPRRADVRADAAPAPAAAPAPEPDWTFTGNVGLYSQYVFRGISQTNEKPALQGGFDLGHKSGLYAGTWASNISWLSDGNPPSAPPPAPSASLEWDFYGGYKGSLPADFGYDLGVLYYWYPGTCTRATTRRPTRRSSTPR